MLANTGPGRNVNSVDAAVEHGHADDVGGQQVGRELDAAERGVDRRGERLRHRGLADAGPVLDEQVALGHEAQHDQLDDLGLALDDGARRCRRSSRNSSAKVGVSRGAGSRPSTMATGVCSIGNSSLLVFGRRISAWVGASRRRVSIGGRVRTGYRGRAPWRVASAAGEEARIRRLGAPRGRWRRPGSRHTRRCGAATARGSGRVALQQRAAARAAGLVPAPAVPARCRSPGYLALPARDDVRRGRSPSRAPLTWCAGSAGAGTKWPTASVE